MLTMSLGPKTVCRMLGLYSNCPSAQKLLKIHLLTDPYPTRLDHIEMTDEEIILQSSNVKIFSHMFAAAGWRLTQQGVA